MKTTFLVVAIVVCAIVSSAAFAVDPFTMSATPSGPNWVYQLTNNSSLYVVEVYLHWDSVPGSAADLAGAAANYTPTTSFISAPAGWLEVAGAVGISNSGAGIAPSGTLNNYTVNYTPGSTGASWFSVGTCTDSIGSNYANTGTTYQIAGAAVPEPGSIVALFGGLAGLGFKLRRYKS
ncbi:MAG: PEP-CTERM sorting domain-containing protein [Armatimonadetes bacterium]|nr:PEP-CTERM sorting domain-containing protein [Armatimonadota bacterium]